MNNVYQILVEILINPIIFKNTNGDLSQFNTTFWDEFALDFVDYETNAEPVYLKLYKLSLTNPEQVFEKLDMVYDLFIKQIAELYLKGYQDETISKLLNSNNITFSNEVTFLNTMQNVIRKSERARLKKKMPFIIKNLEFNLDEEILKNAAKSEARSSLKEKFKQWDKELEKEEEVVNIPVAKYQKLSNDFKLEPIYSNKKTSESSIESKWITWGKLAIAASILIGISFTVKLIIDSDSQTSSQVAVTKNNNINQIDKKESELVFPDVEENTIYRKYLNDSQGFTGSNKNQKIVLFYLYKRIKSLDLAAKKINSVKINKEIDSLKRLNYTYLLKKNVLKINLINNEKDLKLVKLSNQLSYIRIGNKYYKLDENDRFQPLIIENDTTIINQLKKIILTNPD